jgi:carboxyl-terminal processing protease
MKIRIEKPILAAIGAVAVLVVGIWWGGHPSDLPAFMRDTFVANSRSAAVDQALADIEQQYFRPASAERLTNGAIAGAVASLKDPYATYDTPAQLRAFEHPSPQRFAGIGIDITLVPSGLLVQGVLANTPAARAGIEPGDIVTAGDGRSFTGRDVAYSTAVIQGRPGTVVRLQIRRGKRTLAFAIRRALITDPIVSGLIRVKDGVRIGVIDLPTFDVIGIHTNVTRTLRQLLHEGAKGIVLDLRDNGGGLVQEAQLIASLFIRHGKIVITRGRAQATVTLYATGHPLAPALPMAVLVNGGTASAAEIVAGALQDDHRATVVGTHTYGKGVYQELLELPNGGAVAFTVGEYYLPNGSNLGAGGLRRGHGITPNVTVRALPSGPSDPALSVALAIVAKRVH